MTIREGGKNEISRIFTGRQWRGIFNEGIFFCNNNLHGY